MTQAIARRHSTIVSKQRVKGKVRRSSRVRRLPQSLVIIMATFFVVLVVLAFLWKNLYCVDLGYRVARLEKELLESSKLNSELLVEYEMLCSVERIEEIAKKELGMIPGKVYGPVPLSE